MKIKRLLLTSSTLVFFLGACGVVNTNPIPCPSPPILADHPAQDTVVFTIRNQTCTSINAVNIAARECNDYGVDQLDGLNIPSGWELSIRVIPGIYDVWIEECTGDNVEFTKLDLRESNSLDYSDPDIKDLTECNASITVVNHTDKPICHMWIASPSSDRWGMQWLSDGEQIAPGESMEFVVYEDTYDIKAEDCEFNQLRVQQGVLISSKITWEVAE